jgi:hypothetical protein
MLSTRTDYNLGQDVISDDIADTIIGTEDFQDEKNRNTEKDAEFIFQKQFPSLEKDLWQRYESR